MKPFATAFVLMVAGILIIGATDAPPKQVIASPAPPDNSAELDALRAENADLRQQLSSPASPVVDTVAAPIPAVDSFSPQQQEMLAHSNAILARKESPQLTAAAQGYANYQAATNTRGHFANGTPGQRAAAAGFTGTLDSPWVQISPKEWKCGIGEVVSYGHPTAVDAVEHWMQSPGHREAVLEPTYDVCGFGYATGRAGPIYVGLFGNCAGGACAGGPVAVRRQAVQAPKQAQYGNRRSGGGWRPGKFVAKVIGK